LSTATGKDKSSVQIAFLMLMTGAVGIAFAPILVRLIKAENIGPVTIAFWRLLLALPVFFVWSLFEKKDKLKYRRPSKLRDFCHLALCGFFFAGDLFVWHWSILYTSIANSTILPNFSPVFVTLISYLLFKEKFTKTFLLGLVTVLIGAILLVGSSFSIDLKHIKGDALGLLTALFYASYVLSVKRARYHFSTATIMAYSGAVGVIILLPLSFFLEPVFIPPTLKALVYLLALAFCAQVIGQTFIAFAMAKLSAAFSAVALLLQPAVAAFLGWLIFSETIGFMQGSGAVIIFLGIIIAKKHGSDQSCHK